MKDVTREKIASAIEEATRRINKFSSYKGDAASFFYLREKIIKRVIKEKTGLKEDDPLFQIVFQRVDKMIKFCPDS